MIDAVLWWSGVAAWVVLAIIALDRVSITFLRGIVEMLWCWKMFVRFVAEEGRKARMKEPTIKEIDP